MKFLQGCGAVLLVLGLAVGHAPNARAESAAQDSAYSSPDLAPSTQPPWNPPHRVEEERPWERVLRFPGAVISWPLVQLGHGAEAALEWAQANDVEQKTAQIVQRRGRWGFDVGAASLGEASGFGVEVRTTPRFFLQHFSAALSASTGGYQREQATASLGRLALTWQNDWRPLERFYGIGMTPRSAFSDYAARTQSAILSFSVGTPFGAKTIAEQVPPDPDAVFPTPIRHRTLLRVWSGPREEVMTGGRDDGVPSITVVHPDIAAASLHRTIEQLNSGISFTRDERFGLPRWSNGWRATAEVERRDDPFRAIQLANAETDAQPFTMITARAEAGTSFGRDPRTLRLALKAVETQRDHGGGVFLPDDLPSLGGSELAGFERGRFRDNDLLLGKVTYLYPLLLNLELDLHGESGEVFPSFGAARLAKLEQSFGFAFRLREETSVIGWAGLDFSRETTRFRFGVGAVE